MAVLLAVRGKMPEIAESAWLAPDATIIGDVVIGAHSSVWFKVVIRGDVHEIRIGEQTNIQDATVVHATYQRYGTYIGNRVTIGHRAVIHACCLEDESFVGIGAVVMDGVEVPSHTLIAAGAVVPPERKLKPGYLYAGVPAKPIRKLTAEEIQTLILQTAQRYQRYAQWYRVSS